MPQRREANPRQRRVIELIGRLRRRTVRGRVVLWLDLRGKRWGGIGKVTLRNPESDGWPARGETTSCDAIAADWVEHYYLAEIEARLKVTRQGGALATVEDAARAYLRKLEQQSSRNVENTTLASRRGHIENHIVPKLGNHLLVTLSHRTVSDWVGSLVVHGHSGRRPAATNTKANILQTLRTIWREHPGSGGREAPWGKIEIKDETEERAAFARKLRGGDRPVRRDQALSRDEVRQLMRAAWDQDQEIWSRPNVSAQSLPYGALAVAVILCSGARITEACWLRWKDFDEERGIIVIPGSKSRAAYAPVPLQDALRPWLAYARRLHTERLGRPPLSTDLIIQNSTGGYRTRPITRHTVGPTISAAFERAGLKAPGRGAHSLRKTFGTLAGAKGLSDIRIKQFLRHATILGGSTDRYVENRGEDITDAERRLMDCLPNPVALKR